MRDPGDLDPIDGELSRLARSTEPIGARSGFRERVMMRALAESSLDLELVRSARRLIPIAALAAVLAVAWAVVSESSTDAEIAVSDDTAELSW